MVQYFSTPNRFKYVSSQPLSSMRVVVVGPQSAGKTALVAKLRGEGFTNKTPTKGLEVCLLLIILVCSSERLFAYCLPSVHVRIVHVLVRRMAWSSAQVFIMLYCSAILVPILSNLFLSISFTYFGFFLPRSPSGSTRER